MKHGIPAYSSYKRSIAKTLTYRILIIISSYAIVYVITSRHETATAVVIAGNLASTVIYFFHERVWNHIHWGKHHRK